MVTVCSVQEMSFNVFLFVSPFHSFNFMYVDYCSMIWFVIKYGIHETPHVHIYMCVILGIGKLCQHTCISI